MANINGQFLRSAIQTPVLHQDEFVNGRGVFKITSYRDPHETISNEYPIWLTTGRRLTSYHTRTQITRSAGIDYLLAEEAFEVNPNDMKEWVNRRRMVLPFQLKR